MKKVILIILDSFGVGELEDAYKFGDEGSNTFLNIAKKSEYLKIPNLLKLGLANIQGLNSDMAVAQPTGAFGKAKEVFAGKDTTGGHWEIAGLVLDKPFRTYPDGFPKDVMDEFEAKIGTKTLGNYPASGTEIIKVLGEEHMKTGYPIVYTSADSVFQIAMHEAIIPIERQYEICQIARDMLRGEHLVGRVIARPFEGEPGSFKRTERRRDYSVTPPHDTVLDVLKNAGKKVFAIGKIEDIFNRKGITDVIHSTNNAAGIEATYKAMKQDFEGLVFTNLVDFDMLYGHRNDVDGYAKALSYFDERLPNIIELMGDEDLLLIAADHGCDPSTPSTDHSREHIPVLAYGKGVKPGTDLGVRESFADIAATVAAYFEIPFSVGQSFLDQMKK
ncbi:MAG: phosphopentomutase [Eubacteriales bacterium]